MDNSDTCIPCNICMDSYSTDQVFRYECGCSTCYECIINSFSEFLGRPEDKLQCQESQYHHTKDESEITRLFTAVSNYAKHHETLKDIVDKFDERLTRSLLNDSKEYTRCSRCNASGYYRPKISDDFMQCEECGQKTCYECKHQWHEGVDCESNRQQLADDISKSLAGDRIDLATLKECPNDKCKAKFEILRGGCLHFKCSCGYHFCCCCRETYHSSSNPCKLCAQNSRGLHAHHPRNCQFFLRDENIEWLRKLVQMHNESVESLVIENYSEKCNFKFFTDDLTMQRCTQPPRENCQGYCETHFKDLLTDAIYRNGNIDPIIMMDMRQLRHLADVENIDFNNYADLSIEDLRTMLKEDIPLDNMD